MSFYSDLIKNHDLIFREIQEELFVNDKNRFDENWKTLFTTEQVKKFLSLPVRTLIVYDDDTYDSNLENFTLDF